MSDDKTFATRINTNSAKIVIAQFVRIELFYSGKLTVIKRDELPFYIGRDDESCDMVITGDTISRRHCVLQMRDHQVGLLDTSTNGTFVKPGRAESVFIHNEYYPLVGQGTVKLGQRIDLDDPDLLLYKVVTE
jgi:pSer/pThr/pTyr-binding forkhead associated (FHA) protein